MNRRLWILIIAGLFASPGCGYGATGGSSPPDDSARLDPRPLFASRPTTPLASVELRKDHAKLECQSPVNFLRGVRTALIALDFGTGPCEVTVDSPGLNTGASLQFRCPLQRSGQLCREIYEGFVWIMLQQEKAYQPYTAVYSLEGMSRTYVRCSPSPERPGGSDEEATRKLQGESAAPRHQGTLFEDLARGCTDSEKPGAPALAAHTTGRSR